jgi:predicted AlkP superfamily phosphohydrolase/phosphomutase
MEIAKKRVLIIGLDGATFDLIDPWVAAGFLPNLSRLLASGCRGLLASTLQPTTAPAWVTFMTGANQGKHGLFDFVRRRPGSYNLEVTNATHIGAPTIFDIASQHGRYVVTLNIPYTYPPRPVNGVSIGGPFAPNVTRELVYPQSYFDVMQNVVPGYSIMPDFDSRAADPMADYLQHLLEGIEMRERLSLHLMRNEPWDLFMVVFMATDEVHHTYWHCLEAPDTSPAARYRHAIRDVYQRIDQAIGDLLNETAKDAAGKETVVIILSDHGAGPFRWMINLNRWLADEDYLRFHDARKRPWQRLKTRIIKSLAHAYRSHVSAPKRAAIRQRLGGRRFEQVKGEFESALVTSVIAWEHTRAYSLGAGGNIYVNLKGREPDGIVAPGHEYEQICHEIVQGLAALADPDTGAPLARRVYRREELYNGRFLEQAPDLVIEWNDYSVWGRGSYDSQGTPLFEAQDRLDFSDRPLTGAHRPEGILILSGPGVKSGAQIEGARLVDLAPTVLSLLGLPASADMDGALLGEAFAGDALESLESSAKAMGVDDWSGRDDFAYTAEDEVKISQHLQDLGYL